jgi:hypothetical protein
MTVLHPAAWTPAPAPATLAITDKHHVGTWKYLNGSTQVLVPNSHQSHDSMEQSLAVKGTMPDFREILKKYELIVSNRCPTVAKNEEYNTCITLGLTCIVFCNQLKTCHDRESLTCIVFPSDSVLISTFSFLR